MARSGHDARQPTGGRAWLLFAVGLIAPFILLGATAQRVGRWPTLDPRLPVELLVLVALVGLAPLLGRRWPAALRWLAACVVFLIALVHLADVEGPAVLGRDLDLDADLGNVPSLIGLFTGAASPWQVALAGLATILVPALLIAALAWSLAAIERGLLVMPQAARLLPIILLAMAAGALATQSGSGIVSRAVTDSLERQGTTLADAWRLEHGDRAGFLARLGPPPRTGRDLGGLGKRDVWLIFFESYGAVLLDDPALRSQAVPALTQFQTRLAAAGFTMRSARIASPTYGGGSWLAHGTVDGGTWLSNQRLYELETTTDRPTWPGIMSAAGWQSFDIQPGLKTPLERADFWHFDRIVGTDDFGYEGPRFGWFGIPDQYALERALNLPHDPAKPRFAQIVLVSSHIPFHPVPPVLADAREADHYAGHPELPALLAQPPDWNNLAGPYVESVDYDLAVLADWLPRALGPDGVAIILGDHQPPALIGHSSASHDVPIHILSRDAAVVRRLAANGFVDGAIPGTENRIGTMAGLMDRFLDAAAPAGTSATNQP